MFPSIYLWHRQYQIDCYNIYYKVRRTRLLALYYVYYQNERNQRGVVKKPRKFWVRPIFTTSARRLQGDYDNLMMEMRLTDPYKYFNYMRMSAENFDALLRLIGPIIKKSEDYRQPISPSIRLALTLRFLASGDSMVSISYAFRVGKSTVSEIISETCEAIWVVLGERVLLNKPTPTKWRKIADDFMSSWKFSNCIGAIDGKHVNVQAFPHSGSAFYNYKGQHSLILMACCDANYRFTLVDIGAQGRQSDGGVFRTSNMGQGFEENLLQVPPPLPICPTRGPFPFVIVADEAFPLTKYMMRPYPKRNLILSRRVFNYRLSLARRIIENSFGILAARWRVFRKPFIASVQTSDRIIKATVCLHNWIMLLEPNVNYCPPRFADYMLSNGDVVGGSWRDIVASDTGMTRIASAGSNMFSRHASEVREELAEFFMKEGSVDWQWSKIN